MSPENNPLVTADQLKAQCLKVRYTSLLAKPDVYPSKSNWDYIIEHRMDGVGAGLYRKYLVSYVLGDDKRTEYHQLALAKFPLYLQAVDHDYAVKTVFGDTESSAEAVIDLAMQCKLFDAPQIINLINTGRIDLAIDLLEAYQPEYTVVDLRNMQRLLHVLQNMPKTGRIEQVRGVFRSDARYVCEFGHENPADAEYCLREDCGVNICGLTAEQVAAIADYETRVDALASLLGV